jgi:DNA-binding HxlR family transcriptional regulator
MKRKSLEGNTCAVARSLDVIGDWWSLLIIRDALGGIRRFSEFQRNLGLAKNILSTRLKGMVDQGIMTVEAASDGSAYREYVLTEKGKALMPVLAALSQWGREHMFEPGEMGSVLLDVKNRRPLRKIELVSEDGRALQPEDVVLSARVIHPAK